MRWEQALLRFKGWKMTVKIEDADGGHHAQSRHYFLAGTKRLEEGELRLYFNELQFVSVPLFEDGITRLETTPDGGRFVSRDDERGLVYTVEFYG